MKNKLEQLKKEILAKLSEVKDSRILRDLEVQYLGRKGVLTKHLRGIAALNREDKKIIGKLANEIKQELIGEFKRLKNKFDYGTVSADFIDVTLPGRPIKRGHLHPLTIVQNELEDMFSAMGFMVLDGPELESEYYNFEALNIPKYHPARDIQDTFYVEMPHPSSPPAGGFRRTSESLLNKEREGENNGKRDLVMRTHTSPMQIRAMLKYGAPLRCVVPGRVYRSEATDATHEHTLNQLEGLMIGEDITVANLIAVLKTMLSGIFQQEVKLRVRPGYFPFVEPGLEIDMGCTICHGIGCPSCKQAGWLEMLGSGMVHPNVLRAGGIDPDKYSGFAFGMGIDRLVMMKYGIDDIRLFNSGDLRFLEQF